MKRRNSEMKIITVLSTVLLGCLLVITVQGVSSVPTGKIIFRIHSFIH